ncbi:3-oxoacyl-ACP synthase [Flavobacteriaceae bacterium M23B6Z8]
MSEISQIKKFLWDACASALMERKESISQTLEDIVQSLMSETKSSAGDKHETGRAMLQLEREKTGRQLAEIEREQQLLSKISSETLNSLVRPGSLVITSQANYYISISAGKLEKDGIIYYAVSPLAPIAQVLTGNKVGGEIVFQGKTIQILEVY